MAFFVSGGSRGLGRAIVLHAAAEGYDVAFTYRERAELAEEVLAEAQRLGGGRCRAYRLDVRDSAAVERVGDQVLDDFDGVRAVVCNAGITRDGMAATMPDEDWQDVIDTNLTGAFYVARQFLPALIGGGGRIVFVSSISRLGTSGQANYAASKAGLIGLSGTLAKEYGRKGITSNVIVPGVFDTDMTRGALSDELSDFWRRFCPSPRGGDPSDVSSLVLFLASDAAAFINGQVIPVTGGLDWTP